MPLIGILLPGSTLYPSIGIDFLQGIRSCLDHHNDDRFNIVISTIGYGLDETEIHKQAEKLLLADGADAVIVYVDNRLADRLSPLFVATGKLLVISGAGANYPISLKDHSHTLFHSLNDCLYTFMTGKKAGLEPGDKNGIMATSYYDGGYQHFYAMSNAFERAGGEIKFNFVSHYRKEEFNIQTLETFIKSNRDIKKLLCVFCGDMSRFFYDQVASLQEEFDLQLYGSPMMFDTTPGDFPDAKPYVKQIQGYTGWFPGLENEHNRNFISYYKKENDKDPNLFSMQGWETALLLLEYFKAAEKGIKVPAVISRLKEKPVNSPRGALQIVDGNTIIGPAYFVKAVKDMDIRIEETIKDASVFYKEMIGQVPGSEFSTWRNTYLCI